jgi:type IV secretory pathway TrbL component
VKKTLTITLAAVVLIALAASGALFALNAVAGSHQTCSKVKPSELRVAADPNFAAKLEKLARCGR